MSATRLRSIAIRYSFACLVLVLTNLFSPKSVPAQDTIESTALKWIPSDVSVYGASFRLKEQYDRLVNSNAFKRLAELPFIQLGWRELIGAWNKNDDPQFAMLKRFLEQPENVQLAELLKDAVSNEVFSCWDGKLAEQLQLFQTLQIEVLNKQTELFNEAQKNGTPPEELAERISTELLKAFSERIKVPSALIGFKLSNPKAATEQLARLEQLAKQLPQIDPSFAGRVKRGPIGGGDFLSVSMDGSQLPWKQIRKELETKNGEFSPEQEKLFEELPPFFAKQKLQICVGIREDYLLISLGETTGLLERLGTGERLVDRKEFAPIKKAGAQRFASINFVDEKFLNTLNSPSATIDQYKNLLTQASKVSTNENAEDVKKMVSLLQELLDDVKTLTTEMSSISRYSVLTENGSEQFSFSWPKKTALDGTKPLGLLRHVGEQPFLACVIRQKRSGDFKFVDKWLPRMEERFFKQLIQQLPEEEKATAEKTYQNYMPIVKRFLTTTREVLLPAIADGQLGFVVDFQTTIPADIIPGLPPARGPLPIPEIAVIAGVNDAAGVKKALTQYAEQTAELVGILKQQFPDEWKDVVVPEVKLQEFVEGSVYFLPFNSETGVAKTFAVNAGVGDKVGAISAIPRYSKRLLEEHPLQTGELLENLDQPRAVATVINAKPLADFLTAWIDYGFGAYAKVADGAGNAFLPAIKGHVYEFINVLRCWKSTASVTYFEGEMQITHTRSIYQDLE